MLVRGKGQVMRTDLDKYCKVPKLPGFWVQGVYKCT